MGTRYSISALMQNEQHYAQKQFNTFRLHTWVKQDDDTLLESVYGLEAVT